MAKVLIVDDAAFMRQLLKKILLQEGYECVEAANGHEAVATYAAQRPDVVTMDITMPEMDGIETMRAIRGQFPDARVVMCSAMGQEPLVLEALRAGAADFIVKPFKPERVLAALTKATA